MSKKKARHQEILDHALDLFVERGYHQTRTSDISERVGIASGTLFNYFKKKEDILNTLFIQLKKEIMFSLIPVRPNWGITQLDANEHIFIFLKKTWKNFVLWGVKNYKKILFMLQMDDSPLIPDKIKNEIEYFGKYYNSIVQDAIDQGLIRDVPIDLVSSLYRYAEISTIRYIVDCGPEISEERQSEIAEKAFNLFLYGARA